VKLDTLLEGRYELTDQSPVLYHVLKKLLRGGKEIFVKCSFTGYITPPKTDASGRVVSGHRLAGIRGKLVGLDEHGGLRYQDWNSRSAAPTTRTVYPELSKVDDELTLEFDDRDDAWMLKNQ
jgi:hypothetical protein